MSDVLTGLSGSEAVEGIAHIIQTALTPVFLLSGIGTLLNVFNTRLARVSDHTEHAAELLRANPEQQEEKQLRTHLAGLRRRVIALDASIALGAIGAAATCAAAFMLFLGGLRNASVASWLSILFGVALGCTVAALVAFMVDSVLAWQGLHRDGPLPRPKSVMVKPH